MGSLGTRARFAPGAAMRPRAATAAAILSVGVAAGLAPAVLPGGALLALVALILLVGVIGGVALLLRRAPHASLGALPERADGAKSGLIRAARWLFFGGTVMICDAGLRVASITVADVLFLAAFACCCVATARGEPIARVPPLLALGVGLFAVGGLASAVGAASPGDGVYESVRAIWIMALWPWTATMVLRDRRDLQIVLVLWGVSAGVNGLAAAGQSLGFSHIAGSLQGDRATGFTGHPNDLGGAAAVAFVPALALAIQSRAGGFGARLWMTVITLVIAASLVFSGSVGGMSSALLGVVVWMTTPWVRRGARVGLVVVLAGALVAASTLGSATSSPRHRVVQVLSQSSANPLAGSGQSRIDVIKAAWPRIRSDPFVGTGLGDPNLGVTLIQNGFTHVEQVHNAPVATWYETGIVGLTGLLLIFGSVLRLGWSAVVAATTARARTLAWAVVCAYLTFIVFAMTAPLYFQNYGWFAGALIVAMSVEARAGLVRTVAPSGPASRAPVAPTIARVGATG